jgi:hypothetical protein
MILFFGTRHHLYTINYFTEAWAPKLRDQVRVLPYEYVSFRKSLPAGTCIFTDFERLLSWEMPLPRRLAAAARLFPEKYIILNDPAGYLGRFRLLEVLHAQGINDFRAFRADTVPGDVRFPVFVRSEIDHNGPATPLLHSQEELKQALARDEFQDPALRKQLMVTEFCDCREADGYFRKYAVMNIGGTLVPRHLFFSRDWVVKLQSTELMDVTLQAAEEKFMGDFPHAVQILEIFRLAGVEYGRMDYGIRNGRIQVWEINTNPFIIPRLEKIHPLRLALQTESARRIAALLQTFSNSRHGTPAFPFRSLRMLPAKVTQLFSKHAHGQRRK